MKNITKNIPNFITLARIPLLLAGLSLINTYNLLSLILLSLWFLTDLFDGWLARKLQAESEFGRVADHVIDGFTLMLAYLYFIFLAPMEFFIKIMIVMIIFRIIIIAVINYQQNTKVEKLGPSNLGKLGSALQMIAVIYYFAFPELFLVVFVPAFSLSMISAVNYFRDYVKQKRSLSTPLL